MWNLVWDRDERFTVPHGTNPKCYICERYFTDESYRKFSKLNLKEIVSVDSSLFPKRKILSENCSMYSDEFNRIKEMAISDGEQILFVAFIYGPNNPFLIRPIDGFEFLGYDLADESETSSLINCGGYFDEVFTQEDLTQYGLIPDIESAIKIRNKLETNFPDEEHAYCAIFAIWRRRERSENSGIAGNVMEGADHEAKR